MARIGPFTFEHLQASTELHSQSLPRLNYFIIADCAHVQNERSQNILIRGNKRNFSPAQNHYGFLDMLRQAFVTLMSLKSSPRLASLLHRTLLTNARKRRPLTIDESPSVSAFCIALGVGLHT